MLGDIFQDIEGELEEETVVGLSDEQWLAHARFRLTGAGGLWRDDSSS